MLKDLYRRIDQAEIKVKFALTEEDEFEFLEELRLARIALDLYFQTQKCLKKMEAVRIAYVEKGFGSSYIGGCVDIIV